MDRRSMNLLEIPPMDRGLPKWPQMRVRGEPMEVDQAKEIIRRTDQFFVGFGGNDHRYNDRVMRLLKISKIRSIHEDRDYVKQDVWRRNWGFIETEYVENDWISCAFIGGPHGWCHPDGTIRFDDNVGKWPDSEAVMRDWQKLAMEFPFIDLTVVLMDRESCESQIAPICGFRVSSGGVSVFDPLAEGPCVEFDPKPETDFEKSPMFDDEHSHGIPWSWIEEWSRR